MARSVTILTCATGRECGLRVSVHQTELKAFPIGSLGGIVCVPPRRTGPRRAAAGNRAQSSIGPFCANDAPPLTRTPTEDRDMPVRSRGSLLAGTATLAGLLLTS